MSQNIVTPAMQNTKMEIMNAKPVTRVVDLKTGEIKDADRALWLENRGAMMVFGLIGVAIVVLQSIIYGSLFQLGYADWDVLSVQTQFWIGAWVLMSWNGYIGAFALTYGIRTRKIAKVKHEELTMRKGGWQIIVGTICITILFVAYVGIIVSCALEELPFDAAFWTDYVNSTIAIISFIVPIVALCGGLAFAKGIRGTDTVEKAVQA